ncbi:MAG TPA: cation-translocating P-type ATPase [Actinomycetota bacterium]|nr:cation-translocating P-type ATPase [Actinomycetota bacterium]
MADQPRAESAAAVAACRRAGVTPVMITGDDARTAAAIAGRVGILDGGGVLTGGELARQDQEGLAERVAGTRVFARTSPEQKLRLVGAWRDRGAVVAMTGDGVNDAPALRQADIGVAMGVTGTDVSKEAADMILADDNFATIVAAVQEGRRIYDNIRRFVRYLLTTNSGEIWVMFLASVLAPPIPLLPVQILWINLVTDGLPAIALGLEPVERDAMRRPPRAPTESIFARGVVAALWVRLTMAAVCLALLVGARAAGWPWQTMVFTTLTLLQLGHALAVLSERESFFSLGAWSNPFPLGAVGGAVAVQLCILYLPALRRLFDTQALDRSSLGWSWSPRPRPSSLWSSRSGASAGGPEGPAVYLPDGPHVLPPMRAGYCWAGEVRPSSGGDDRDRDHGGADHARAVAGDGGRGHDTRRCPAGSRHAGRDGASPS